MRYATRVDDHPTNRSGCDQLYNVRCRALKLIDWYEEE
jgi:hypothetical protein